jgi:hypothetical protein
MRRTFDAGPFTTLQVGVTIHSNRAKLHQAHRALSGDKDDTIAAFCARPGVQDDIFAELHFNRQDMPLATVVHETYHAVLTLARYLRLNLEDGQAEELLAEASSTIVDGILAFKRETKASRQQSK